MLTLLKALPAVLAVLLVQPAVALPGPATVEAAQLEGDIEHVAGIGYSGGSDVEFGTFEVVKLSDGATGDPVCEPDDEWFDGCARDEDGEIVYETEQRDFAFAGRLNQAVAVIDITVPDEPAWVANVNCRLYQNDIQLAGDIIVMARDETQTGVCTMPDGSNLSVNGFATADVSDPRNPVVLGRAQIARGAHNVTVHPVDESLVYVSNSDQIGDGRIHIWDISNPATPVLVQDWVYAPVMSPHDITFNAEGTRAYLAARTFTRIVDTTDPRNPELISSIPHAGYLSHQSDPTPDGKYLLVGEELLGGGFDTPSPGGPVYVWDIRDEENPVKVGAFGADATGVNGVSTSHVFRINPDGYTMAIGWYRDGVHVIDYSDIRGVAAAGSGATTGVGPKTIGWARLANANVWSAKMWQERHPGYVFVNDINRGFDVFYVSSLGPGFVAAGTIKASHPLNFSDDIGVTRDEWESECDYTPSTNGVDGWVARVPAPYGDGTHSMRAESTNIEPGQYDLDLYFYDGACILLDASEAAGDVEIGEIPQGTEYVMVASYFGQGGGSPNGHNLQVRLSAFKT